MDVRSLQRNPLKIDGSVKSRKTVVLAIPAKAGIQYIQGVTKLMGRHSKKFQMQVEP